MRHLLAAAFFFSLAAICHAQTTPAAITGTYPGFSLTFQSRSDAASGLARFSIVGQTDQVSRERFGVMLGAGVASAPVIEILNDRNVVLKAITAGDLRTGASDGSVKSIGTDRGIAGRYARAAYQIALPGGRSVRLIVKALATGEPGKADAPHPLVVTYALEGDEGQKLAMRATLPVEGGLDAAPNGFVVSAYRSGAAFAAVVAPAPQQITAAANAVTITSRSMVMEGGGHETAMLWMRIDGVSAGSPAEARESAQRALKAAENAALGPDVIVVSTVDRENVSTSDTVSMTLIYVNVGMRSAAGLVLNNPVPQGTRYVAASAQGDGAAVTYDRAPAADGNAGEISAVRWTMSGELRPGEERTASFKAVVQ